MLFEEIQRKWEALGCTTKAEEWFVDFCNGDLEPFWMFGGEGYGERYWLPWAHLTGYDRVAGMLISEQE